MCSRCSIPSCSLLLHYITQFCCIASTCIFCTLHSLTFVRLLYFTTLLCCCLAGNVTNRCQPDSTVSNTAAGGENLHDARSLSELRLNEQEVTDALSGSLPNTVCAFLKQAVPQIPPAQGCVPVCESSVKAQRYSAT